RRQGREGEGRKEVMLALLAESALRSLLLGAAVWLGLKLLRVRNPHVLMTAWTLVLAASLAMPALMRLVTGTVPGAPPAPPAEIVWPIEAIAPALPESRPQPVPPSAGEQAAAAHDAALTPLAVHPASSARSQVDWRSLATGVYLLIGGLLLLR